MKIRRATVEDLTALVSLWQAEKPQTADLERDFKDFQVAVDDVGVIHGALAVQISGKEGRIHTEAFSDPAESDALRTLLLDRIHIISTNFGLTRLWTQLATPFWHTNGFQHTPEDLLAKLPSTFPKSEQPWLFIQLKEEQPDQGGLDVDQEFALFKQAEQENSQRIMKRAKTLKVFAFLIVIVVVIISVASIALYLRHKGNLPPAQ